MEFNDLPLPTQIIWVCVIAFIFSTMMTWLTRVYALRKKILDIPNERSAHYIPTPQGGGIAIALIFTFTTLCLGLNGIIESNLVWALVGGGMVIAGLGYIDDVYTLKIRWRIIIQFLIALWAVYWLNGFATLDIGAWKLTLDWIGYLLAVIAIVWCINLYNFMDGIDGLAGSEGFFVSVMSGIALWWMGDPSLAFMMWVLAAAVAGFVMWNWPPAKIFLGDVGSCFLGYIFAVAAIHTANKGSLPIVFWLILLAVFICDATFTLILRAIQGKRWYSAHREHAYQSLISFGISHKQITISILIVNFLMLMPLAFATIRWPLQVLWFLGSAMVGLFLVWVLIKARSS